MSKMNEEELEILREEQEDDKEKNDERGDCSD